MVERLLAELACERLTVGFVHRRDQDVATVDLAASAMSRQPHCGGCEDGIGGEQGGLVVAGFEVACPDGVNRPEARPPPRSPGLPDG
ncbi:hypothetical protein [Streptomyces sp. NPDC056544]|uniref:hypothetical protein n=1 Tax=unclassified Streptomyces TaxID=2593676 RepID=UPI0036B0FC9A